MGAVHSSVERRRIHGGDEIATVPDAQRASGHGPHFCGNREKGRKHIEHLKQTHDI